MVYVLSIFVNASFLLLISLYFFPFLLYVLSTLRLLLSYNRIVAI